MTEWAAEQPRDHKENHFLSLCSGHMVHMDKHSYRRVMSERIDTSELPEILCISNEISLMLSTSFISLNYFLCTSFLQIKSFFLLPAKLLFLASGGWPLWTQKGQTVLVLPLAVALRVITFSFPSNFKLSLIRGFL